MVSNSARETWVKYICILCAFVVLCRYRRCDKKISPPICNGFQKPRNGNALAWLAFKCLKKTKKEIDEYLSANRKTYFITSSWKWTEIGLISPSAVHFSCTGLERSVGTHEVGASRISGHSAYESGKVVSPSHRPSLPARRYLWCLFLLQIESTLGP